MPKQSLSDTDYAVALRGRLFGLLSWNDFDEFWERVFNDNTQGWYIYQIGEQPPQQALPEQTFVQFCRRLIAKLKREHEEDYCGIVYVDDKQAPTFIKIYDPGNLGKVCGSSDSPTLPGWVISKLKPIDLLALSQEQARRSSWKRFLPW